MLKAMLWVLYYRCACIKVTIDGIFYYTVTIDLIEVLNNIIRLILWIGLFFFMTPLELLMGIGLDLCDLFHISNPTIEKMKQILNENDKTKEDASKEYKDYKETVFADK